MTCVRGAEGPHPPRLRRGGLFPQGERASAARPAAMKAYSALLLSFTFSAST